MFSVTNDEDPWNNHTTDGLNSGGEWATARVREQIDRATRVDGA